LSFVLNGKIIAQLSRLHCDISKHAFTVQSPSQGVGLSAISNISQICSKSLQTQFFEIYNTELLTVSFSHATELHNVLLLPNWNGFTLGNVLLTPSPPPSASRSPTLLSISARSTLHLLQVRDHVVFVFLLTLNFRPIIFWYRIHCVLCLP
jgi:hypothetical protein